MIMIVSSAKHQRIVNVPKAYLWKRMSDFKNVGTLLPPPIIDEVKCESNHIGSLRYLTLGEKQKYPGEIIERLGDNSLDIGFSGFDLYKESEINNQKKINVVKKYNFGKANLVVAIPDPWIDVQTIADLEEIAFEFRDKKKKRLRVATKYPNLTREFLFSKGVTQFRLVDSLGATEAYPFTGSAELITDISSTGETLKANNLRVLKDGEILKSQACIFTSKKNSKKKGLKKLIQLLSK